MKDQEADARLVSGEDGSAATGVVDPVKNSVSVHRVGMLVDDWDRGVGVSVVLGEPIRSLGYRFFIRVCHGHRLGR